MLDQELRDQLSGWARSAAGQPVPDLAVLRRRLRRRRTRLGGATFGLAAGVTAAVLALLAPWAAAPGTGPAPASARHQARPPRWSAAVQLPPDAGPQAAPYVITMNLGARRPVATILDWRTGKVIATFPSPPGQALLAVAAAGDDRTFVLDASRQVNGVSTTVFYELRLDSSGRVLWFSSIGVGTTHLSSPDSFAISPDGSKLAIATVHGPTSSVQVVSLSLQRLRSWRTSDPGSISQLTWAGDRRLAFDWTGSGPGAASQQASGLRLLDTAADGTDLLAAPLVIPSSVSFRGYTGLSEALASSAGSSLFATMVSGAGGASPLAEVVQFSLATGQPERAVTPPVSVSGHGTFCAALWSDPSGRQLAVDCGPGDQGTISDGAMTQRDLHIPAPGEFGLPRQLFVAW